MSKYYRVKKDNFLWDKGAILERSGHGDSWGYQPINDLWDVTDAQQNEYITAPIVEQNPNWFERVYEVKWLGQVQYATKAKAREILNKTFKEK